MPSSRLLGYSRDRPKSIISTYKGQRVPVYTSRVKGYWAQINADLLLLKALSIPFNTVSQLRNLHTVTSEVNKTVTYPASR